MLLAFLAFELRDNAVDGCIARRFVHTGELLQRVLQMNGLGEWHQFVEHLGALVELSIVGSVVVEQSYCLAIRALCVGIAFALPVDVAQTEQQHSFLYARTGSPCSSTFIGRDGVCSIPARHIDVADGVIHLVEIFLVLVGSRHALEPGYHLVRLRARHHLGHGYACVELHLIGRILPYHTSIGIGGGSLVAEQGLYLSHDEPLACALLASHLVAYDAAQILGSVGIVGCAQIVVGERIVPLLLCSPVYRVAPCGTYHVLGVIVPPFLYIAFGKPSSRLAVYGRLCAVEP